MLKRRPAPSSRVKRAEKGLQRERRAGGAESARTAALSQLFPLPRPVTSEDGFCWLFPAQFRLDHSPHPAKMEAAPRSLAFIKRPSSRARRSLQTDVLGRVLAGRVWSDSPGHRESLVSGG